MPEAVALDAMQAWMQAALLAGKAAPGEVRARVRGDNRLTAEARLGIYADAYRLRLLECLRAEYPLLAALAGPTAFDLFAQGYLAATPSRSFTLYEVGAGFADYLAAAQPAGSGEQAPAALPAALARLERAIAEVSRARGIEGRGAMAVRNDPALAALLGLSRAHGYRRPDSVRLLTLPFDFAPLLAATTGAPPLPEPTPTRVAVVRLRWRVRCHALEPARHEWLATLPALDGGTRAAPFPADPAITAWLPQALARGLIVPA